MGALVQQDCCSYRKRKETPGMYMHRGKAMCRHRDVQAQREMCHLQSKQRSSGETNPAATLI